ncbi:enoyl-CoA hydratase/isomerase [Microbulbifer sp. ZKSA006]|uniref:enoyl-CoA hydratase/isomerase n=1 Tax=Microbulbifer sp. ZKSA006 TaxID=3243390 RepID=UPI00403A647C
MGNINFNTLKIEHRDNTCFVQIHRPEANNTINNELVDELAQIFSELTVSNTTLVVLEGLPEVFCFGADFSSMVENQRESGDAGDGLGHSPEKLYDLWYRMVTGPFITISHVKGKANAGGIGFLAASDIVLTDESAQFSLSELLFGLIPACVMPFLVRRIGFQNANYFTLMTQPMAVEKAFSFGLVDAYDSNSQLLLRRHLMRLKCLSKKSITRYKKYMNSLNPIAEEAKIVALRTNLEVFEDQDNINAISRYVSEGVFPWEAVGNGN